MTAYIEQLLLDEAWRRTRRRRRFRGSLVVLVAAGAIIVVGSGQGGDASSSSSTAAHRVAGASPAAPASNVRYRQRFGWHCALPSPTVKAGVIGALARTDRRAVSAVRAWEADNGVRITALTIRRPDGSGGTGVWGGTRAGREVPLNAMAAAWTGRAVAHLRWVAHSDLVYAVACVEQAPADS
jgi:hypothetical protein